MFIWSSIAAYCAFSIFAYYNQLWSRDFRGGSQGVALAVSIMGFLALLTGLAYVVYYGWFVSWLGAIVAFVLSLAATLFGVILEKLIGTTAIQVVSPLLWPIFAVAMFWMLNSR